MRASSEAASAVAASTHVSLMGLLYEIEMSASPERVVRKLTSLTWLGLGLGLAHVSHLQGQRR